MSEQNSLFATGHDGAVFEIDGRMDWDQFDDMLAFCVVRKASDVTVQSGNFVMADIGGQIVRVSHRQLTLPEVEEIVRYVYGENGPAEIKSGHDLDPAHEVKMNFPLIDEETGERKIVNGQPATYQRLMRFRVNITGGRVPGGDGIEITIRTLPEIPPDIRDLGIEEDIIENFRPKDGMIIVTGPTGSGKSTLLSSGMRMIMEREEANEKIIEYSAPVEYVYDKVDKSSCLVWQSEVPRHIRPKGEKGRTGHADFAHCVRNALRRKPTIILIGESRDKETITASVEAAQTGHVLYTTMHTIGVAETIHRALLTFPAAERAGIAVIIMESLRMIVTQILLPKVGGGKVGCREYLVFDRDTRRRFMEHDYETWPSLTRKIMAEGDVVGQTMDESAKKLLDAGLIEESTYRYVAALAKQSAAALEAGASDEDGEE